MTRTIGVSHCSDAVLLANVYIRFGDRTYTEFFKHWYILPQHVFLLCLEI